VLAVQIGLLAIVPARHLLARSTGTPITLKTRPLDPYDLLSGYYVILRYQVEHSAVQALDSDGQAEPERGDRIWITIRRAEPAWTFVRATRERPDTAGDDDTLALPARWEYGDLRLIGAGRLYVPETQREEAEKVSTDSAFVDARVGADGTVALLRLRIGDKVFGE
jgi:uncharacterized membrane-anchored protein